MRKAILMIIALALALFAVSCASASIFDTYDYHTYVIGHGDVSWGYTNTESSSYEKVTTETNTPWGSQARTAVKRTNTESFQPNYPYTPAFSSYDGSRYYNNDYRDSCYYTYDGCWNNNHDVLTARYYDPYEDPRTIYPSNWRYKTAYYYDDYGNDEYGYDYYYSPRYDWHAQVYNWNY
jgi:hypothetical protein